MSLKRIIDAPTLAGLLKKSIINKEGVRLLDCSYAVATKPDWKKFEKELYGNFREILAQPSIDAFSHGRYSYLKSVPSFFVRIAMLVLARLGTSFSGAFVLDV
ncbi:unnamed protein product [Strongylus vulgaris]|uniref:Uncharacterized protein n=1 Tax=Strongylus vulgaris TaxID=40348 RepID=A0A3P7JG58_STRVU|nr:unnamed protein product [Strongylus vulgaris]